MSTQTEMSCPPDFDVSTTLTPCTAPVPLYTTATQSEDDKLSTLGAVGGKETAQKQSQPANHPQYTTASANSYIPTQASTPKKKIQHVGFKPGPLSSKQGLGNRPPKGSEDPVKTYNKFDTLNTMDPEMSHSLKKGAGNKKK
jgi:hypothetical protein